MAPLTCYELLIGGEHVAAASGETIDSVDPTTGEASAQHARAGAADVDRTVRAARAAFESDARRSLSPRAAAA